MVSPCKFLRQSAHLLPTVFLALLACLSISHCSYFPNANPPDSTDSSSLDLVSSLKNLTIAGQFDFNNTSLYANDFGNRFHFLPLAVLLPKTVSDIATIVKYVFDIGHNSSNLTITARGHGHSLQGQSQNQGGIVISMESLEEPTMYVQAGELPYVDVSAGELWINVLQETLKHGLAPKSWTDYLNLSVGGTLSYGGIGGQAFRHGPQINNVDQLEVITGKGDIVNCSAELNSDLFNGVLGGLGQFGIITKARISLERAPKMVRLIRLLYSTFGLFAKDQEQLISAGNAPDYIEGFVMTNIANNWNSTFNNGLQQASPFGSEGASIYSLEIANYYNPENVSSVNEKTETILSTLNYIPHTLFQADISYAEFLDRIHLADLKLQGIDLRNVTNPWLTLLIPKSTIHVFAEEVFGNILANISYGPILLYPFNQSSWRDNTSLVTPTEDVIYLAAFLTSVTPSSGGLKELDSILALNQRILDFCETAKIGAKQYLPYHETQDEWQAHFEIRWDLFAQRKAEYDPLSILGPGQRIFHKG